MISRNFFGKKDNPELNKRLPPGQYIEKSFPVLTAGPTPPVDLNTWKFEIRIGENIDHSWSWEEFMSLPKIKIHTDIHCVTKWSKFDTNWEGVSLDTIFEKVKNLNKYHYLMAYCYGGYTTNLPLEDTQNGQAMIATTFEGENLSPEHGGPARLVVPKLYFWKSAKWIQGIQLMEKNKAGYWEQYGYHNYGDPWKEQRYWND